ncbi:hypothetical protein KA082_02100 [Candidatus Woesebacteria bacterium]|nr:hypothetical protein [Candidatus Woesebacteria bacterium]
MKKNTTALLAILLFCLSFFAFSVKYATVVYAQDTVATPAVASESSSIPVLPIIIPTLPINLTISPVTLSLETDPGVPVSSHIKIRNNSSQPESLKITIGTFSPDESGGKAKLRDPRPDDTFIPWLSVPSSQILVNPGEWTTVPVSFSPPPSASLSYYYSIMISRVAKPQVNPGESAVEGAPALLVLTTVHSPNTSKQLSLTKLDIASSFLEYLPQTFSISIKNSGNVHVIPSGSIFIDGQGKKDLAVLPINPNAGEVLPNSTRQFSVNWNDGFPVYSNDSSHSLSWDFSKANRLRFGKYTAHLIMVYDDGSRDVPVESSISFWVVPWKILIGLLVIIFFVILGARSTLLSILKYFKKKK